MSLNNCVNIIFTTALQNKCLSENTVGLILIKVELEILFLYLLH